MATSKKFSELPAASSVGNGDLFAIAHEDALAETGYVSQKLTAAQAGQKVNGDTEYPTSLPSFPENGQNPFAALEKLNSDIDSLYPVNTASGSIANFTTSLAKPLTALTSTIVAQQSGTGTPSPSNPRSISGVSSVGLTHTGKNLFDKNNANVVTGYIGNTQFNTNNANTKSVYISIKPNTIYTVSKRAGQRFVIATSPVIPTNSAIFTSSQTGHTNSSLTITAGADDKYLWVWLFLDGTDTGTLEEMLATVQIEVGSTAMAYEAYNAETKTIALPSTIYGGSVNCINGTGTIENAEPIRIDSLDWTYDSANQRYVTLDLKGIIKPAESINKPLEGLSCEVYVTDVSKSSQQVNLSIAATDNANTYLIIKDTNYTDVTTWLNAIGSYKICYPLATPVEITDLTTDNFTTIAGEQNIFSNSGDVTVSFKQGIQEYIDAQIAATQALIL